MAVQDIASAMRRVESAYRRRPQVALIDDTPAVVRWDGGLRTVARSEKQDEIATEMPVEIGGAGDQVTPGWLLRAALASCAVTRIAMSAAVEGIELTSLQASASSRSDARGLMGLPDAAGQPVATGPGNVRLHVRIGARGVSTERLRALVLATSSLSPVTWALEHCVPVEMRIDVEEV
jgi:uncharacterized OsmC-like protein